MLTLKATLIGLTSVIVLFNGVQCGGFFDKTCWDFPNSLANPEWKPPVEGNIKRAFQLAHFGHTEGDANKMEMAHVYSWGSIKTEMETCLMIAFLKEKNEQNRDEKNYEECQKIITMLFRFDDKAYVHVIKDDMKIWDTNTNQNSLTSLIHYVTGNNQCYLTNNQQELPEVNVELEVQANALLESIDYTNGNTRRQQNCVNAEYLLDLLNSVPANLRYGNAKMNNGIGRSLDPMGDNNGVLTANEIEKLQHTLVALVQSWFIIIDGEFYMQSSTGLKEYREKFYVKCPSNRQDPYCGLLNRFLADIKE